MNRIYTDIVIFTLIYLSGLFFVGGSFCITSFWAAALFLYSMRIYRRLYSIKISVPFDPLFGMNIRGEGFVLFNVYIISIFFAGFSLTGLPSFLMSLVSFVAFSFTWVFMESEMKND